MIVRYYKKVPVRVEAVEYDGSAIQRDEITTWTKHGAYSYGDSLYIETLEGDMKVSKGDFVIKGVAGEFYPCKPDIFAKTYESSP